MIPKAANNDGIMMFLVSLQNQRLWSCTWYYYKYFLLGDWLLPNWHPIFGWIPGSLITFFQCKIWNVCWIICSNVSLRCMAKFNSANIQISEMELALSVAWYQPCSPNLGWNDQCPIRTIHFAVQSQDSNQINVQSIVCKILYYCE